VEMTFVDAVAPAAVKPFTVAASWMRGRHGYPICVASAGAGPAGRGQLPVAGPSTGELHPQTAVIVGSTPAVVSTSRLVSTNRIVSTKQLDTSNTFDSTKPGSASWSPPPD